MCSPTRATLLTGRNHFRDCVDYVYCCSDMTECEPNGTCSGGGLCRFAPQRTFTIADAVRLRGDPQYESLFLGKWHLGSLYNDSSYSSSPATHGFNEFNATVGVAPTAKANWQCNADWVGGCDFGHYGSPTHCCGTGNPCGATCGNGCCFNYWWNDANQPHGVRNLSWPSPYDDSRYLVDAFSKFLSGLTADSKYVAQFSFHNCHIPFIGTPEARRACAVGETCRLPTTDEAKYTSEELDFYGCLNELDASVGAILDLLDERGDRDDTLVWFSTDNGPEVNCPPLGFCGGDKNRPSVAPGSAGILRGRKRDIYEGGHRVPGIVSWPARYRGPALESWSLVSTVDILPTMLDILEVQRPAPQADWLLDGVSILPIFDGRNIPDRGMGWWYRVPIPSANYGFGFRYGYWKFVQGSTSCTQDNCSKPQLYNLSADLGERHDLAAAYPDTLADMIAKFAAFNASIQYSRAFESRCD